MEIVQEDVLGFPVMHWDHEREVRVLTTLGPQDKGTEDLVKHKRILHSQSFSVNFAQELIELGILQDMGLTWSWSSWDTVVVERSLNILGTIR